VRRLVCCALVLLSATARAESAETPCRSPAPEPVEAYRAYARPGRRLEVLPTAPPWDDKKPDAAQRREAWLRLSRGDADGALGLLACLSDSAEVLYLRGLAALAAERFEPARDALERVGKLEPSRLEAQQALGVAWLGLGDTTHADEAFSAASDDPRAFLGHAVALGRMGRRDEAEAQLRQLIAWKGVLADAAATDLALLLRDAGRRREALGVFASRPVSAEGRLLAAQLVLDDDPRAAASAARSALELRSNFTDAQLTLARALVASGDSIGAERAAQRALELAPDAPEARALLEWVQKTRRSAPAGRAHR
jgi:tetratricopeptide (TPR) repeat protein